MSNNKSKSTTSTVEEPKKEEGDLKGHDVEQTGSNQTHPNLDDLLSQLEILKHEKLKALADFENFKKRVLQERQEFNLLSNSVIFSLLLEIADDLARAIAQIKDHSEGLGMILEKIKALLKENNIVEIEINEGDVFDPHKMEAIGTVTVNEIEKDNHVLHVERKGYKYADKDMYVRLPRVIVGKKG